MRRIYLDYNAGTPIFPVVQEFMGSVLPLVGNPSSVHAQGRKVRALIEEARAHVAHFFSLSPHNVIFTSGASEAASMFLQPFWKKGKEPFFIGHLYICVADHPAFLSYAGFEEENVSRICVDSNGVIVVDDLLYKLSCHRKEQGLALVSMHAVNNETGVIQPFQEIYAAVRRMGGIFVLDAVQAVGRIVLDMRKDIADHLIISSHKMGGPSGAGAILSRDHALMPVPLIRGGGQESGFRGGTENVLSILGFGAAASSIPSIVDDSSILFLRRQFEHVLEEISPDVVIHGKDALRVANTIFFSIPGYKAETLQIAFDLEGISLSAGAACSSGKLSISHVLEAMSPHFPEGALRISIGYQTTQADVDSFRFAFAKIMQQMRKVSL